MANGKPQDHPVTDTVIHGLHPFPPDLEDSVRQVHTRNPGVFNDLGNHVAEARVLLKGLLEHHGHRRCAGNSCGRMRRLPVRAIGMPNIPLERRSPNRSSLRPRRLDLFQPERRNAHEEP